MDRPGRHQAKDATASFMVSADERQTQLEIDAAVQSRHDWARAGNDGNTHPVFSLRCHRCRGCELPPLLRVAAVTTTCRAWVVDQAQALHLQCGDSSGTLLTRGVGRLMMVDPTIPASAGALDAEWLTRALRSTGTITAARVTSCHIEPFGEGKGFSGQIARVALSYDVAEASAPASLIAKVQLPHPDPDIRAAVFHSRIYEREFCFYRDVAQKIAFRTPRVYYSALRPETGECLLLLEDLAPAQTLDMLHGCTAEDAALVLRHLAAFHAAWWEQPQLAAMDWLPAFDQHAEHDQQQYARSWEVFLTKVGELLPDGLVSLGARLKHHGALVKRYLGQSPRTFLHGDFHLHNLLFGSTAGARTLAVIDWQACCHGRATRDVAHFLVTGLRRDERRAHELDLLKLYHAELVDSGVREYSVEQCVHDYRFTMLDELHFLVMVLAHLDYTANEAAGKIRDMALERVGTAILDHKVGELLPA
jgi:hypothetical protein